MSPYDVSELPIKFRQLDLSEKVPDASLIPTWEIQVATNPSVDFFVILARGYRQLEQERVTAVCNQIQSALRNGWRESLGLGDKATILVMPQENFDPRCHTFVKRVGIVTAA